ncbi:MAG: glycerol-3-phosphate dehydrogenase/oxidase [Rhodobacteraceae bacterium]|nr:glycerol-3-phosphate dehydrogenase/oxidase [Paracoccaceae bacterium]
MTTETHPITDPLRNHGFRARNLRALKAIEEPDVLILGGGVNGVATLRDLALNGVSCVLIDAGDFCAGASGASSRMAHGGLRYLEGREFRLVAESARERNRLIANAGHIVKTLKITVPLSHWLTGLARAGFRFMGLSKRSGPLSLVALEGALRIYEAFGRREHPLPDHETLLKRDRFPRGLPMGTKAVVSYYDGQITQPEGLIFEMLGEALDQEAEVVALNHLCWNLAQDQIVIEDRFGPERFALRPKVIVNATGAWIDRTNAELGGRTQYLRGIKGAHLVLDNADLHRRMNGNAYYFDDGTGRMVITLPVGDNVLVGTTEVETPNPDDQAVSGDEIAYLLTAINGLFSDIEVRHDQIVSMTTGIRPLRRSDGSGSATSAARDHALEEDRFSDSLPPVLSLVGGKWTTFRAFGEETADRVLALLGRTRQVSTATRQYPGAAPCTAQELVREREIDAELAHRLLHRYGALARDVAGLCTGADALALRQASDICRGEIRYAIRERGALTLEDLILRRTRLSFGHGLSADTLPELADILSEETGRGRDSLNAEIDAVLSDPRLMGARITKREGAA